MEDTRRVIKVGSRKSQLALIQTKFIIDEIKKIYSEINFEIVTLDTLGDKVLDKALPKIGEKALFTKELEDALLDGRVHFVVHSLKDLPTTLPEGLGIGAIFRRDNKYDTLILHEKHNGHTLATLPSGCVIGTSSLRRVAQLKRNYSHLNFETIRGNLNTRLKKLDEDNKYDGIVLAVAGIHRMNWHHRISEILKPPDCLYAVGQGALAVEARTNDWKTLDLLSKLTDIETLICCAAERAYLWRLGGGCSAPVGVSSTIEENKLVLHGSVLSLDGSQCLTGDVSEFLPLNENVQTRNSEYLSDVSSTCVIIPQHLQHILKISEKCGLHLADLLLKRGAGMVMKLAKEAITKS